MLFNTFHFLVFLIFVLIFYYCLPHKRRWLLLLAASYYFYMCWKPALIVLIIFSTGLNYGISLCIAREKKERKRKQYLLISLFINFGLLFIFKYLVFVNGTLAAIFGETFSIQEISIILPMGISFYTFQAASYTIDVYKRKIKPVRHYGKFSLYISFFPQLVAGPIERAENLLPQFFRKKRFQLDQIILGFKIMLLGYFKKVVIADRVAVAVNTIYNSPNSYSGLYFVLATILFAFQIYCDFSGYSDIAVGVAKTLGFNLMENFKNPYFSRNIKEFWRRWHISLSTWFSDYVYIPLGGSRCGKLAHYRNLFITFLVSGLWHGANWTFFIWGGIHGILQILEAVTRPVRKRIIKVLHLDNNPVMAVLSICITFSIVCFAWIFFRANTISDAIYIVSHLFTDIRQWKSFSYVYGVSMTLGLNFIELFVVAGASIFLLLFELLSREQQIYQFIEKRNIIFRFCFYSIVTAVILTMGVYYNAGEFIYFQF